MRSQELGQAFELEVPLGGFGDLPDAVEGDGEIALLVLDADRLLMDETDALAPLLAALAIGGRPRVAARDLPGARADADAEAVLTEFGVAEIAA